MFEDSLLESGGRLKTKSKTTTTIAFIVQIALVGVLVLIPLIYTEALPKGQLTTFLVAPPPPPPPPPPPAAAPVHVVKKIETDLNNGQLRQPTAIPKKVAMIKEDEPPPSSAGVMGGVAGGVPGGSMNGVIGGIVSSAPAPVVKMATPQKVRVSQGVSEGLLLHKVTPNYPALAKQARIQGSVVLQATIGKDGSIQNLRVLSGHPMLTQSALDAVKQWKYKPYLLNGEAVEVETTVQVNFTLSGG
ncbi:outer membrane transport energization protein TonB [Candidatus Koribacter versatilis Ellin345]|uniref:Outer membrane transport energization protein TonB n=1 Tax=Koribacter versatilis (strain Ellin345) TaxID=204669 RepID=Q1IVE7_KORVE|nr:energy transducer TonB [Candidatus Koribacter versatilis]ABF39153.1 outer membrane transport energization protein TonB [Candidatus Koribacter versatilis Ellin345]